MVVSFVLVSLGISFWRVSWFLVRVSCLALRVGELRCGYFPEILFKALFGIIRTEGKKETSEDLQGV